MQTRSKFAPTFSSTTGVQKIAEAQTWKQRSGYTIDTFTKPRLSLRANIISGNRSADSANLQTFNPLFPKGKYFGELTPVGPYNLINLLGAVGLTLTDQVAVSVQGGPYWRYSAHDAVYGLGGNIVRASDSGPGDTSSAHFMGTPLEFVAEWNPAREFAFLVSYSPILLQVSFLRDTGPWEAIHFFEASGSQLASQLPCAAPLRLDVSQQLYAQQLSRPKAATVHSGGLLQPRLLFSSTWPAMAIADR